MNKLRVTVPAVVIMAAAGVLVPAGEAAAQAVAGRVSLYEDGLVAPCTLHPWSNQWEERDGGTQLRAGAWDIEGDEVALHWSVVSQPAGASASLETPDEGKCRVTGMTAAGDYVFRIEASDGVSTVAVDHTVPVYP
ncbi:MAG: hypothetical protein J7M38_02860 [Armatimonadetes bacterium]|nr:hypothetical protein [Armatimonadota bacterium]